MAAVHSIHGSERGPLAGDAVAHRRSAAHRPGGIGDVAKSTARPTPLGRPSCANWSPRLPAPRAVGGPGWGFPTDTGRRTRTGALPRHHAEDLGQLLRTQRPVLGLLALHGAHQALDQHVQVLGLPPARQQLGRALVVAVPWVHSGGAARDCERPDPVPPLLGRFWDDALL
jgi:hypothetical protein